ncbi:hypothetical protein [Candidatus Poriferisocius sp.]|uniref:hypothetical protein n=1 Tax=Candidatus Poriferisocius sp. TaxID=3101276 RepID=UPI003B010855
MIDMGEARHSKWLLAAASWVVILAFLAVLVVVRLVFEVRTYKLTPLFIIMGLLCVILSRLLWVRAYPDKHPYAFEHSGIKSLAKMWPKGYWGVIAIIFLVAIVFDSISMLIELFTAGTLQRLLLLPFGIIGMYIVIMLIPKTRELIISEIKELRDRSSRFRSWLSYFYNYFSRSRR